METQKYSRRNPNDRELQQSMAACLRVILEDIRGQYQHCVSETERLKNAGVAIGHICKALESDRKEVNGGYVPANPDRGVRRP